MSKRSYTDEQFIEAVTASISWAEVFRKLGLKIATRQYVRFKSLAEGLAIDLSHMKGQSWNLGRRQVNRNARPLSDILVKKQ